MSTPHHPVYDCIVIGVGSMGASACYHLAAHGQKVLGIEQFSVLHDKGAHSGQTRIIRKAYFEHPDYIPLLHRAYENWAVLEAMTGEQVYYPAGLLYAAPAGHTLTEQVKASAAMYNIPLHSLSVEELAEKYPQFVLTREYSILLEPEAGFLDVGKAITLYAAAAKRNGAEIHTGEKVLEWQQKEGITEVITDKGKYQCKKLVITAGPWSAQIIPGIKEKLHITRQVLSWMQPAEPEKFSMGHFPCWMIVKPGSEGSYYGFPTMKAGEFNGPAGMKMALHYPGTTTTPDTIDRNIHPEDLDHLTAFAKEYIPAAGGAISDTATCMYSNSPDEHFVIDHLPGTGKAITVAWGFSGHGFKFVSVVGELVSQLVVDGATEAEIGFLKADRLKARG